MTAATAKRHVSCGFCGHEYVKLTEASERQMYQHGYDYHPGEYFIGTCPACQMRDCYHESATYEYDPRAR